MAGLTPDEIYEWLRRLPSLKRLDDADVRAIADAAEWQLVPAGASVYSLGRTAGALYILETGLIRLQRPDARQAMHTRERVDPGDVLGVESLSPGQVYLDEAVADEDSGVFSVSGQALTDLVKAHSKVRSLGREFRLRLWQMRIQVPDRQPDETVLVSGRQHWSILIERLAIPLFVLLLLIVGSSLAATFQIAPPAAWLAIGLSVITAAFLLLAWSFADWWSDQYIITNQRVIHLTVRPYISERQREAPLSRVINTTVNIPTPWASWLGWSDVTVGTAGMQPIRFERIANGPYVAAILNARLLEARQRAEQADRAVRQKTIRESLRQVMDPLATPPPPPTTQRPTVTNDNPIANAFRYFWPKIRDEQGSMIIYRKHRIVLLQDTGLWLLAVVVLFVLESVGAYYLTSLPSWVYMAGVILFLTVLGRLLWVYDDWRIDVYMLTDRAVIDVERTPFYLSESRKTASLDNLQDVSYTIPGPVARFLNYGKVVMETAGASGRQEWTYVPDPRSVQNEIISRMEASRRRRVETERQAREAEIKEWIGEYHRLQQDEQPPGATPPPPTPP